MRKNHSDYIEFLSNINLNLYRERFRSFTSVEENLPKDIQILDFI
jgi:hypothetical protein